MTAPDPAALKEALERSTQEKFATFIPIWEAARWALELIERETLIIPKVNGSWPKGVVDILRYDVATLAEAGAEEILDALYEAAKE